MQLDVQWFLATLVDEGLMTKEACESVLEKVGANADLEVVAQSALDTASSALAPEEADNALADFERIIEYAQIQTETGELPPAHLVPEPPRPKLKVPVSRPPTSSPTGTPNRNTAASRLTASIPNPEHKIKAVILDPIAKEVAPGWTDMPDFNRIGQMDDARLKEFALEVLRESRRRGASDLHLSALANPFVRHCSENKCISSHILSPEEAIRLNTVLLNEEQKDLFRDNKSLNYALAIDVTNRFRVCLMCHKDGAAGSYRMVPEEIMTLEELGFPKNNCVTIERFLDYHNGLVLVTGPIGSGKTTTLASMVNVLNTKRHDHIITVEDPIEIVQYSRNCNVTQREVHRHTSSYKTALKGALREDPDIIVIGELHDLETIEMAITASETGHLVIGTLHTCDAANTLNRLLDVFPPSQQPQIRTMTAGSLRGIICQRLLPTVDGSMTVAAEIMVNNTAVGNIISDGRTHQLRAVLQTGQNAGMITMDESVLNLYRHGRISRDVASYNIRGRDIRDEFTRLVATEEARKLVKHK
ncbi:MAG: PilT/PilU family type 4a pilus ATPase [Victivallales bacterium]|nr:PilT/PilU family type 4a pilus ATPase [Victivallales bacterium]